MIGVYGANGFIGRHLVRRLANANVPVRAISRRFDQSFVGEFESRVEIVEADLREPLATASSLEALRTVVQLVSTSSPAVRPDQIFDDMMENVLPHLQFLQSCVQAGVRRCIFLSSGGTVYGPDVPVPTPESSPTNPISTYGLTKLIIEKSLHMYGHVEGLEYLIFRVANAFGPGQVYRNGQGLIPALLDRRQKGLPVRIFGDGRAMRDYVYVEDIVDAIEAGLSLPGAPKLILNLGSGEAHSVMEVIEAIECVIGERFECEYTGARKTDVDISCLDVSQAKAVLGWAPKTSFRDGIAKAITGV